MKNLTGFVTNANYQLLVDLYELNMAQAYLNEGMDKPAIFDLGIRGPIKNRGYLIACGIGEAAALVKNISFSPESIEYLKGLKKFTDNFLGFLEKFRFEGDIYGVRDGEVVFPGEPLVKVKSSLAQGQLVETILLNTIGFQTLVATKASRVCQGAAAAGVIDFGLRRAQGGEAGLKASKAAYVGGCIGTSNLLAGSNYGIPVFGTVAH
ncbi:nicotinate phosphoribosyltransferase, partial [Candidatus Parvarchaeota archaeon]|nr:nicotinate phosphoribosyltransferase [Candidatus Parvarchaeota archaeon]